MVLLLTAWLAVSAGRGHFDAAQDRAEMTAGVGSVVVPGGLPGPLSVSGTEAFVVLTGHQGDHVAPLAAATRFGLGRAFALGHESFFGEANLRQSDNRKLFLNTLGWLSKKGTQSLRVGLVGYGELKSTLAAAGDQVRELRASDLESQIAGLDVLCMKQDALDGDATAQNQVRDFIKGGHGLLIAGPGWGWQSLHPNKRLAVDQTGNRLLSDLGISFTDGGLDGPFSAEGAADPLLNADAALTAITAGTLTGKEGSVASATLERALTTDASGIGAKIQRLIDSAGTQFRPTQAEPIRPNMALARLAARLYWNKFSTLAPDQVKAYPSFDDFPGAIPPSASRVDRDIAVDTSIPGWHSGGLYVAPGEVVTVSLPPSATKAGLFARIGSQTDGLWENAEWHRFPEISNRGPLSREITQVANPFGGVLFIDVPDNAKLGVIQVHVRNAVPSPHFVRGKTSIADWLAHEKDAPGPWAELEGHRVILSVPSTAVRNLQDPEALMAYWDQVMDLIYAFYAAPNRVRPERYCVDRQISAGYMHSGYPIMTFEDVANTFTDITKLRAKGGPVWGFYHEMGHNFQRGEWTFSGTGEVTNNLFSLYGSEMLNQATPATYELTQGAMSRTGQRTRLEKYLAGGAKFSDWQSDPFLALTMYAELREAFGWAPFTKVFAEYQKLSASEVPQTELQKHDQWMVRFSRAVQKNLGPFFLAWGVPVSESARVSIAQLPAWMPPDWPAAK